MYSNLNKVYACQCGCVPTIINFSFFVVIACTHEIHGTFLLLFLPLLFNLPPHFVIATVVQKLACISKTKEGERRLLTVCRRLNNFSLVTTSSATPYPPAVARVVIIFAYIGLVVHAKCGPKMLTCPNGTLRSSKFIHTNLLLCLCDIVLVSSLSRHTQTRKCQKHDQANSYVIHACMATSPAYTQDTSKFTTNVILCTFPRYTPSAASTSLSFKFFSAILLASRAVSVSVSSAAVAPPECWKGTTLRLDENISLVRGLASAESGPDNFLLFLL